MKNSQPVKLRWKKLDDGRESAFLDITIPDRPRRKEYLRIYRGGKMKRKESADAERLAMAICEKRLSDYNAARTGVRVMHSHKFLFAYFDECSVSDGKKKSTTTSWRTARRHLEDYVRSIGMGVDTLTLGDVNADFCKGYLRFLQESEPQAINRGAKVTSHGGRSRASSGKRLLSPNSVWQINSKFRAMMHQAVIDGLIAYDPSVQCGRAKTVQSHREYLTVDEVKTLMATPYSNDAVCRAFLFSCMTGLRISDVRVLDWADVTRFEGHYRLNFRQKKTGGLMYLDISDIAHSYMGEESTGRVFPDLPLDPACNAAISKWVASAGIEKHITFHCSRHTAAVTLLTSGAEIYTVAKILGHSSLSSTQVYAEIVDKKKVEAIDAMASLFGDSQGTK